MYEYCVLLCLVSSLTIVSMLCRVISCRVASGVRVLITASAKSGRERLRRAAPFAATAMSNANKFALINRMIENATKIRYIPRKTFTHHLFGKHEQQIHWAALHRMVEPTVAPFQIHRSALRLRWPAPEYAARRDCLAH